MTTNSIAAGEFLYEFAVDFTGLTGYGVGMEAIASGQTPPPPEGARFDVAFEGKVKGDKMKGDVA